MTKALENELRAAGYTEAQIEKEAAYLERVAWENQRIGQEAAWTYGIHNAHD
jgi:hypothetical protein